MVAWVSLRTTALWVPSSVVTAWPSCPFPETCRPAAPTCFTRPLASSTSPTLQVRNNADSIKSRAVWTQNNPLLLIVPEEDCISLGGDSMYTLVLFSSLRLSWWMHSMVKLIFCLTCILKEKTLSQSEIYDRTKAQLCKQFSCYNTLKYIICVFHTTASTFGCKWSKTFSTLIHSCLWLSWPHFRCRVAVKEFSASFLKLFVTLDLRPQPH